MRRGQLREFEDQYSEAGKRRILAGLDDLHREGATNLEIADYLRDWGTCPRQISYWRETLGLRHASRARKQP